jgi:hypothetical protein
MKTFTGTSRSGDLAEALSDALRQATESSQTSDVLVTWTIEKISGKRGGIAGLNEICITIAAET